MKLAVQIGILGLGPNFVPIFQKKNCKRPVLLNLMNSLKLQLTGDLFYLATLARGIVFSGCPSTWHPMDASRKFLKI